MHKGWLEAFSDGVIAIIITIMVLELHAPRELTLGGLHPLVPVLLSYVLSFVFVGIYWNNHHHLFQASSRVTGGVLWANLHLLFWLSLIPFATNWMGQSWFAAMPVALYGVILLMAGVAYAILLRVLIRCHGKESTLARAIGSDWKGNLSVLLYVAAIGVAFVRPKIACGVYIVVALIWLIPDRRIERAIGANISE